MILTGNEIDKRVKSGEIIINPFNESQVNPNSYNFCLGKKIAVYKNYVLDTKVDNEIEISEIPAEGMVLQPNIIYLGHTEEIMGSNYYAPIIRGRSSIGRLGLFVHITADLIDIGSINQWTLQMYAVQPVRIYPGMQIGQVTFWQPKGEIKLYSGKYQGSMGPGKSQIHLDFFG